MEELKGWIYLDVLCHTEQSEALKELHLDYKHHLVHNKNLVQVSNIVSIQLEYNGEEIKGCFVYSNDNCMEVKQTKEEVIELIKIDKLKIN